MSQMGEEPKESAPAPGQPTSERVHGIFSGIADSYDLFNRMSSLGIDRSWRRAAVREARLKNGSRILDLCAGTGDLAMALAREGVAAEVMGSDFVPEMLEVAQRKAVRHVGPTSISFCQADAQDLPFEDSSFDVVTVAFGVRNLPDRSANFAEVLRVLKPGGRYVVLEFSRPGFAPWRGLYHFYLRNVIPAIGGALSGDRESFVYLNDSILQFPTQTQLAAELRHAGFAAISWKSLSGGIVAIHTAVK